MKNCTRCGKRRPLHQFHNKKATASGKDTICKFCRKVEQREKYSEWMSIPANRQRKLEQNAARRKREKDEEYDSLFAQQGGVCAICGDPPGEGKRLHKDHCHRTGKKRSLLCQPCNLGLGWFKDDPQRLRKAIKYLKEHAGA